MFDLGWMELLIIGVVALIVVGPKDLPMMFRTVGVFVGKAKRMAREFQVTMNAAASESGLKETADILKKIDKVRDPTVLFESDAKDYIDNDVQTVTKTNVKKKVAQNSKNNEITEN